MAPQPIWDRPPGRGSDAAASERRFVLASLLALLAVTSIPTLYGFVSTPPDQWYSGIVDNVHDTGQYLSWMREAGQHLFTANKLTSEPNPSIFLNLHWWIPGRLAALAGLSLFQTYQVLRVLSVVLLCVSTYVFVAYLVPNRTQRRFAFWLSLLGSGLGWIWVVQKPFTGTLAHPRDIHTVLGNAFYTLVSSPHLGFAAALTLFTVLCYLRAIQSRSWRAGLVAGALALALGLGHIYDLVTVWAVAGVFGLVLTLRDGVRWHVVSAALLLVAVSAPAAIYWGWVSSPANPAWQQALAQYDNLGVFTPAPLHLLILLGLPFVVALTWLFCAKSWRALPDGVLLMGCWLITTPFLVYLPVKFQIMLLTGFHLPVGVLAALALFNRLIPWLQRWLSRQRPRWRMSDQSFTRLVAGLFLLAVVPANLYLLAWRVVDLGRHRYPYYLYQDDLAAMQWLAQRAPSDSAVLSSFEIGHYLPGVSGSRAFLGNAVMTLDFYTKEALVREFFDAAASDERRLAILRQYGIAYVFFGPAERRLGAFDPNQSTAFVRLFSSPRTSIFALAAPALAANKPACPNSTRSD